jgi:signal transduction histidine kinase
MEGQPAVTREGSVWEAERGRRTLDTGIVVFRWAAFAWMVVLAIMAEPFRRPILVWGMVAVVAVWTVWLTDPAKRSQPLVAWVDLIIAVGLILVTGLAIQERGLLGDAPFLASPYALSPILVWGSTRGVAGGLGAGLAIGVALTLTRPLNGVGLTELTAGQVQGLATSVVLFLIGGGTVGLVAHLLDVSTRQVRAATEAALEARERAARLAERQVLARRIHDSVLQTLSIINKRGREMEERGTASGREGGELARLAAEQARELRELVTRQRDEERNGITTLRDAVEEGTRRIRQVPVEVSGRGEVELPANRASELTAAVRQALENVERHADASKVTLYLEAEDGWASVSIRDDGRGFRYDEQALRAAGRLGMVESMKGRVEDLGGIMRVESAPGEGTEVELRLPIEEPR